MACLFMVKVTLPSLAEAATSCPILPNVTSTCAARLKSLTACEEASVGFSAALLTLLQISSTASSTSIWLVGMNTS